jgi:arylformamidase
MVRRVVELNHELHPAMFLYPGSIPFSEERVRTYEADGWQLTRLTMATHHGTHVDAPSHFSTGRTDLTLSAFRGADLVGPGVVLRVPKEPGEGVTADDCERALAERGRPLPERPIVLLHTGFFDAHGDDFGMYSEHHTYVTGDGAEWLVKRGARIVGIDASGFERHGSAATEETVAHNALLGAGILLIEELVNLGQVDWPDPLVVVAPLPLRDADGAPARVLALELDT